MGRLRVLSLEGTLWCSHVEGSERLQLTIPGRSFLPRWSSDGTHIAYDNIQAGRPLKIFLISAQGGTPQEMPSEKEYQVDPTGPRWQTTRFWPVSMAQGKH
jgi:Tol biopolymer transport system component